MSGNLGLLALSKYILNKIGPNAGGGEDKIVNEIPQGDQLIPGKDTPQAASPRPEISPLGHLEEVETIRN